MGNDQKAINKAEIVKDAGVTFDSSLKFEAHMSDKINKANSTLGIIRRTFEYLDDKCFSTVFKSLYRVCKPGMESIFNETHNSTWQISASSN